MQALFLAAALLARMAASLAEPSADSIASLPAPAESPAVAAQEPEEPKNEWTGAITLFFGYTSGNSESEGYGGQADAVYRREKDRTTLQLFYDKKFSDGDRTIDKRYADAKYDYFFSEKTYWWAKTRFDVDREADLELQWLVSTGIGHQFLENETWKVNGEAGISYVDKDFDGSASDTDSMAARLGYSVDYTPSERWSIGQITDYYPSLEDSDDWFLVANTRAALSFTESMAGTATYLYTHQESPPGNNEQDDHNVLLGLTWKF